MSRLQTRQKSVEVSFGSLGLSQELNASSRKLPDQHAETSLDALLQVPHHQVRRKFSSSHAATNQLLKFRPSVGRAMTEVLVPVKVEVRERRCPRLDLSDPKVLLGSPSTIVCQLVRKREVCECSLF